MTHTHTETSHAQCAACQAEALHRVLQDLKRAGSDRDHNSDDGEVNDRLVQRD
jgi:hypothetical protein